MPVITLVMNIIIAITSPLRRSQRSTQNRVNRRFYKQGFMTDEIKALQSIFHKEAEPHPKKRD
jgi:hypothetical protein